MHCDSTTWCNHCVTLCYQPVVWKLPFVQVLYKAKELGSHLLSVVLTYLSMPSLLICLHLWLWMSSSNHLTFTFTSTSPLLESVYVGQFFHFQWFIVLLLAVTLNSWTISHKNNSFYIQMLSLRRMDFNISKAIISQQ